MDGSEELDRRTRPVFVRSQADSVLLSDRVLANCSLVNADLLNIAMC